jgi:hypothetical protein
MSCNRVKHLKAPPEGKSKTPTADGQRQAIQSENAYLGRYVNRSSGQDR